MTKIQSQSNSIPLYLQVKNKIKQEIRSGILKASIRSTVTKGIWNESCYS